MFPLFLDVTDRLAVVVGGGAVGRRKAADLLAAGAQVRLVCLEARPAAEESSRLAWLVEPYRPDHLEGAGLIFAAATREVNRRVVADARARGLWVDDAADPDASDFFVPAVVRRGDLVLAVSTGGKAPFFARRVRERLETEFDDTFGHWVALLAEVRQVVRDRIKNPGRRLALLDRLSQWDWLDRLRTEGPDVVRAALRAEVRALADDPTDPV